MSASGRSSLRTMHIVDSTVARLNPVFVGVRVEKERDRCHWRCSAPCRPPQHRGVRGLVIGMFHPGRSSPGSETDAGSWWCMRGLVTHRTRSSPSPLSIRIRMRPQPGAIVEAGRRGLPRTTGEQVSLHSISSVRAGDGAFESMDWNHRPLPWTLARTARNEGCKHPTWREQGGKFRGFGRVVAP